MGGDRERCWSIEEFCEAAARWPEAERLALLRLVLVDGLGTVLIRRLLARFGRPSLVLEATTAELEGVYGLGPRLAAAIRSPRYDEQLTRELELIERLHTRVLWAFDPAYPPVLRMIPSPPLLLFVRGDLCPTDEIALGVVGSRMATAYGIQQTLRIVGQLAEMGFTIVSGLARGIDVTAHRAALLARGRTIAVLASGLADIYPPEHFDLAERIVEHGALVSEAPMTQKPKSGLFPMRNRIISGLSLGVFVVEAALRSGAMITVGHALEQGREVFALPGPVHSTVSQGCHRLIREGAWLVESALDIYEVLREPALKIARRLAGTVSSAAPPLQNDPHASRLLEAIGEDPVTLDEIINATGFPVEQTIRILTRLELSGQLERLPGSRFRKPS